jgi:hypothetical protein
LENLKKNKQASGRAKDIADLENLSWAVVQVRDYFCRRAERVNKKSSAQTEDFLFTLIYHSPA